MFRLLFQSCRFFDTGSDEICEFKEEEEGCNDDSTIDKKDIEDEEEI